MKTSENWKASRLWSYRHGLEFVRLLYNAMVVCTLHDCLDVLLSWPVSFIMFIPCHPSVMNVVVLLLPSTSPPITSPLSASRRMSARDITPLWLSCDSNGDHVLAHQLRSQESVWVHVQVRVHKHPHAAPHFHHHLLHIHALASLIHRTRVTRSEYHPKRTSPVFTHIKLSLSQPPIPIPMPMPIPMPIFSDGSPNICDWP